MHSGDGWSLDALKSHFYVNLRVLHWVNIWMRLECLRITTGIKLGVELQSWAIDRTFSDLCQTIVIPPESRQVLEPNLEKNRL